MAEICTCGEKSSPLPSPATGNMYCTRCFKSTESPEVVQQRQAELREATRERKLIGKVVTMDSLPGHEVVEVLGLVSAAASTTNQQGSDRDGGIRNLQEGRLKWAVDTAIERMVAKASGVGANAVIGVQVAVNESEGSALGFRSTGAVVTGTAVVVRSQGSTKDPER